jgi:hypothetical protein
MEHRHITDTGYTRPAIDDIIERGGKNDWAALQSMVRSDPDLCRKVNEIASHNLDHPFTIRYHFWLAYSKEFLVKNVPDE